VFDERHVSSKTWVSARCGTQAGPQPVPLNDGISSQAKANATNLNFSTRNNEVDG
jgi:hypothetical protein